MQRFLPWIALALILFPCTLVLANGEIVVNASADNASGVSQSFSKELSGPEDFVDPPANDLSRPHAADEDRAVDNDDDIVLQRRRQMAICTRFPRSRSRQRRSAIESHAVKWTIFTKGRYVVPYDLGTTSHRQRKKIRWCFRYLQLGSNLRFRRRKSEHQRWIQFQTSNNGYFTERQHYPEGPVLINMDPDWGFYRGLTLHEIMHSLGFGHEHQRTDRDSYVLVDPSLHSDLDFGIIDPDMTAFTDYDMASIMHYCFKTSAADPEDILMPIDEEMLWKYNHANKMFLTKCDWAGLNTAYPGHRLPPECVIEDPPSVLIPTESPATAYHTWLCHYSPDTGWNQRRCIFPEGTKYPDLSFIPTAAPVRREEAVSGGSHRGPRENDQQPSARHLRTDKTVYPTASAEKR